MRCRLRASMLAAAPPPLVSLSMAHFHYQHDTCMQCDEIEFAAAGAKVSQQNGRAL